LNVAFNTTFIDQKNAGLGITVPSFQGYATGGIGGAGNNIQINSVGYAPNSFLCMSNYTMLIKDQYRVLM
jgi:iron complex outermembrane receptor protein